MERQCRYCGWFRGAVAPGYGFCVHPGVRRLSGKGKGNGTPRRDTDTACGAFCLRETAEVREKIQEAQ